MFLSCMVGFKSADKHVKMNFEFSKTDVKVGDEVELLISGEIEKSWYVYSSKLEVEGPMVTELVLSKIVGLEKIGDLIPVNVKEKNDEIWGGKVHYFSKNLSFKQKFKVTAKKIKLVGSLKYQTCNDEDGTCIPGSESFSL